MGKDLIILGANFFENAAKRAGDWYLDCLSKYTAATSGAHAWVYDGEARAALRGNTVNRIIVNAVVSGQLDVYVVKYADTSTHITSQQTKIATINVSQGYGVYAIPETTIGNDESLGFGQDVGFGFYYGQVPGAPFSPLPNTTDAVGYNFTLNIGVGYEDD